MKKKPQIFFHGIWGFKSNVSPTRLTTGFTRSAYAELWAVPHIINVF